MNKTIVLVGQSGSGKSSVANLFAKKFDISSLDLDSAIEEHSGKKISELIETEGLEKFRELETEELESALLSDFSIVAAGGGAVIAEKNRKLLLADACVIWLDAPLDQLVKRLSGSYKRPLLEESDDMRGNLFDQRSQRMKYYMLASDFRIDVSNLSLEETVEQIASVVANSGSSEKPMIAQSVKVPSGHEYHIYVGRDILPNVAETIDQSVKKVAVVTQENIGIPIESGVKQEVFFVENGENAKRLKVVESLCSNFSKSGLTRNDMVLAIGGGVVTDLGGFAAAMYHRGIKVIHVATSLLAQIDAAIGGKCGVNLPEGKNLVGAFWQPEAVFCDISSLDSLPAEEFLNGLGELAKYHFIYTSVPSLSADQQYLSDAFNSLGMFDLVNACVKIKAAVVSEDEKENGLRAFLNYGHTMGHALEKVLNFQIPHGEAVARGLIYAAELAFELGRISEDRLAEHYLVLERYGLTPCLPAKINPSELIESFSKDKKAIDGVTFILDGPNGLELVVIEDKKVLLTVCERLIEVE